MSSLKVLIVDDSIIYRKIIERAIESVNTSVTIQKATNGEEGIKAVSENEFDVVLLDVNMPGMNGLETLQHLKNIQPKLPIVMVSVVGAKDSEVIMRALGMGAMDFVTKPIEEGFERNLEVLCSRLKTLFFQIEKNKETHTIMKPPAAELKEVAFQKSDVIVIASSTGGPHALEILFQALPKSLTTPILLVQHIHAGFTKLLADSLSTKTQYSVIEAKHGEKIQEGYVYIAPTGHHMKIMTDPGGRKTIELIDASPVNGVCPSADVLFKSVAMEYHGKNILAVVMTGMGQDGTEGVKDLKSNCNTHTICQSEDSCVVFGMPKSVIESGLADEVLDLAQIAKRIGELSKQGAGT